MTPQETFEYRLRWKPGHCVALHSDLEVAGKAWCKRALEPYEWGFTAWTAVYEHTFCFENIIAAQNFEMEFSAYAKKVDRNES